MRVDALLSRFKLSDRQQYGDFLVVQAAAFLPIEAALDAAGAANLLPDWPVRRRGTAIRDDLRALGRNLPAPVTAPTYADAAEIWGGMYVLEGSRLGGAMLHKAIPAEFPRAFLTPGRAKMLWPQFVAALERTHYAESELGRAGASAIATFACFECAYDKGVKA
jgi:heme oxygenase (biliverdin-IX-beta and delta-forming)